MKIGSPSFHGYYVLKLIALNFIRKLIQTLVSLNKVLYISDGCCTEFNIYYFILYLF